MGHLQSGLRAVLGPPSSLEPAAWDTRHRRLLWLLEGQAAVLVVVTVLVTGWSLEGLARLLPLVAFSAAARSTRLPRRARACATAAGLFTISALVVHLAHGEVVAHFHYFVMLPFLALYEDRLAFWLGVVYVVVQHGIMGTIAPGLVYAGDMHAMGHPWLWALLHGGAILAASVGLTALWSANEAVRRSDRTTRKRAEMYFDRSGAVMVDLDRDGRVRAVNPAGSALLGRERDDILGEEWFPLALPTGDIERNRELFAEVMALEIVPPESFDSLIVTGEGTERTVRWYCEILFGDDACPTGMLFSGLDVSAERLAEQLLEQERRDLAALHHLAHAVASLDDARQEVVDQVAVLTGGAWAALVEPLDGEDVLVFTTVAGESPVGGQRVPLHDGDSITAEVFLTGEERLIADVRSVDAVAQRARTLVPDTRSVLYRPIVAGDRVIGILVVAWNRVVASITAREASLVGLAAHEASVALQRRATLRELTANALADPLTGIANRRVWDRELPLALARAKRNGQAVGVGVMDLNGFKALNDTKGHDAGDRLLCDAAAQWEEALRETDLLVRFGGDEFALVLPGCGVGDEAIVAARMKDALPGHEAGVGVGIAVWDHAESADALVRRADELLYADKAASAAGTPLDAPERLAAVARTDMGPGTSRLALDRIARTASWLLDIPIALVSVIDDEHQHLLGIHGLTGQEADDRRAPIENSLCKHTITGGRPLIISDTRGHPLPDAGRAGDLGLVAYAGVPLVTSDGLAVGAMCALDGEPRTWTADQLAVLRSLADRAAAEIETGRVDLVSSPTAA